MQLEVSNIGPVTKASLELRPGVNELEGENGVGKTHILTALARALGDDSAQGITIRDGSTKGSLSLNGVVLLAVGKASRRTGHAETTLVSTSPLASLVDPGIKDPVAAERARIQALLQLIECPVTDRTIATLVNGDEDALAYVRGLVGDVARLDIVNAADRVRRLVHGMKREHEDEAARAEGEMIAASPEKPPKLTEQSIDEAQTEYDKAVRALERLSGEASQRAAREKEREEIRATLGEKPDVANVESLKVKAEQLVAESQTKCADIVSQIAVLQERLENERASLKSRQGDVALHVRAIEEAKALAATWERRKAILDTEITGATSADVETSQSAVTESRSALEVARESQDYRDAIEKKDLAQNKKDAATKKAEKFGAIARGVTGQLGGILTATGLSNLTVDDDRLCVIHSGGTLEAFSRLSLGQRTRIAADLTVKHSAKDSVIPLDPKFWLSLGDQNKKEFAEICAERGLFVVTEKPSSGALRVSRAKAEAA